MWPEVEKAKNENRHELVLGGNEICERIEKSGLDQSIFTVTTLNYLDLHDCNLTVIPEEISKLTNLQSLVLHSNKLEKVPSNVFKLVKLKLLDVSRNQITEISGEIDNLTNVVTLNFSYNKLEFFPKLEKTVKITVFAASNNRLKEFPQICRSDFTNFSELTLSDNEIEIIPPEIGHLTALKLVELGQNKIKIVPYELYNCSKLKTVNFKNNPISDRRFLKLINQCHTKQIMDYVKAHSPKTLTTAQLSKNNAKNNNKNRRDSESSEEADEKTFKYSIKVHYADEKPKIIIDEAVKSVREFFLACLVKNVNFTEEKFKKFIQIQNKLHETVCAKRNSSTIATHDFYKIAPGDLTYTLLPPDDLLIRPLNRATDMTGAELFNRLQTEAHNLRKEKKRNTYSGIHKYLYLIEGHPKYPCLINSENIVISFPPITNSDVTKIDLQTKNILIEVTSSLSIHSCKVACDTLLKEMVKLFDNPLDVVQVKTVDKDGNLKVTYPSKTDLNFEGDNVKIIREQ